MDAYKRQCFVYQTVIMHYVQNNKMEIAEKIAKDVVKRVCHYNLPEECSLYSFRMQDLVMDAMTKFKAMEALFNDLTQDLTLDNATEIFHRSVEEMFQHELNWGRLVSVYMLGAAVAKRLQETSTKADVKQFTKEVFVPTMRQHVSPWVHAHGGWNAFLRFFAERHDAEQDDQSRFAIQLIALGITMLSTITYFYR